MNNLNNQNNLNGSNLDVFEAESVQTKGNLDKESKIYQNANLDKFKKQQNDDIIEIESKIDKIIFSTKEKADMFDLESNILSKINFCFKDVNFANIKNIFEDMFDLEKLIILKKVQDGYLYNIQGDFWSRIKEISSVEELFTLNQDDLNILTVGDYFFLIKGQKKIKDEYFSRIFDFSKVSLHYMAEKIENQKYGY